ncbi:MAG TPA: carbonate dehydratase [Gammaproteobacteria bacterium]|nr:carbonate dehydratase [Gammaproteobacteria bacterium]
MKKLPEIFANNRAWAGDVTRRQPGFFKRLAEQQNPKYLWIGCSDSRVPANEIMGLMPGEVFVHRNVANVVVHTDLNCLSVIQYAVDVLKVQHIIVCGHYGCGGIQAAWRGTQLGLIDNWLRHVQDVSKLHHDKLTELKAEEQQLDKLCDLNVLEQAKHVCWTTIVQDAWARGQSLSVHGWVYGLRDGLLRDLGVCISSPKELD